MIRFCAFLLGVLLLTFLSSFNSKTEPTDIECVKTYDSTQNRFIYTIVDSMPRFPSGVTAQHDFIIKNLINPSDGNCISGTVVISFIVETDGTLTNFKIEKGIDELRNSEALRVAQLMPNWTPGVCNGQVVPVKTYMTVRFGYYSH